MLKRCVECNIEKHLSEFRRDCYRQDGYRSECKVCSRAQNKSRYSERYGEKYNARNRKKYYERVEFITSYKLLHPCIICGEDNTSCLDFHHLDMTEKEYTISHILSGNIEKIVTELKKCVVLCSNCHRKIHAGKVSILIK